MLYVIPIEPLEERYSAQWLQWVRQYLMNWSWDFHVIDPPYAKYDRIAHGAFLDVVQTNVYKNAQLDIILKLFQAGTIKDGDVFWFHDMWFPGMEMLAYIRDGLGLKIKIYGCLHAGTYDQHDFTHKMGMTGWGRPLEDAWFNLMDGVFVATCFHRDLVCSRRTIEFGKIHVTGFPMYAEDFAYTQLLLDNRERMVVFPHRLDNEKQPYLFDEMARYVSDQSPGWRFMKTKEECQTKKEYYSMLRMAKFAVSFALQETWGIAMQEAVLCGCIPIVPKRLSYDEMYPDIFKYEGRAWEAATLMLNILNVNQHHIRTEVKRLQNRLSEDGRQAFDNMMNIMGLI